MYIYAHDTYIHVYIYIPVSDFFRRAADADDRLGEHARIGHLKRARKSMGGTSIPKIPQIANT